MNPLQTEIHYQGRVLKQTRRDGDTAIYEIIGKNGLLYGYEVIVIKKLPSGFFQNKWFDEREGYPGSEEWGQAAWSFSRSDYQTAEECFNKLTTKKASADKPKHG